MNLTFMKILRLDTVSSGIREHLPGSNAAVGVDEESLLICVGPAVRCGLETSG